jgi:hypothetical protein
MDGLAQIVQNPNSRPIFIDGLKLFRINNLEQIQDSFLQFLDGVKLSRILEIFLVIVVEYISYMFIQDH